MGYYCTKEMISKLFARNFRILAICALLTMAFLVYLYYKHIPIDLLYAKAPYLEIGVKPPPPYSDFVYLIGAVYRLIWYIAAIIMSISFLTLVPGKKTSFSIWGTRTLQVYLLHLIVLITLKQTEFFNYFNRTLSIAAIFLMSVLLAVLLSNKYIERPFKIIMKLKIKNT